MKKVCVIALVLVLACSAGAYAAEDVTFVEGSSKKMGRGIMNILDATVEIPGTLMHEVREEGPLFGVFKGLAMGVVNTVVRASVGVFEVVTFFLPSWEPILDDPQFLNRH